ncbi:hypothetical protein ACIQM0_26790 [Streptomyces sp. NPDC091387]|uniref:hypothetical protein n=1 Tax=Streptomyces sp. NPDC091387 TaxID=3365998 RepID=UPI003820C3FD
MLARRPGACSSAGAASIGQSSVRAAPRRSALCCPARPEVTATRSLPAPDGGVLPAVTLQVAVADLFGAVAPTVAHLTG